MQTTIITVTYNSDAALPNMLDSLPPDAELIIVDNASETPPEIGPSNSKIKVILNQENEGFGRACNTGAAAAKSKYLLFLNPDTVLKNNTIEMLERAAEKWPSASAFNPRITNSKGKQFFRGRNSLNRSGTNLKTAPTQDSELAVLSGSALFVSKDNFEEVGGFDDQIFLYHEDEELSFRLASEIGPVMHVNDANVLHIGGASTQDHETLSSFKAYHLAKSRVYIFTKHNKHFPRGQTLLKGVGKLLRPKTLFNGAERQAALAYIKGALAVD